MSLHHASKYLASKGRGEDTMLVHMTPREVKGLQELALAHGGSLTINPETGLPEAGILKKLLPMVGGAALMMIPGMQGFGGALAASAIMGGGMYAATGSIKEGLLAGLGAFGGANLAGGLAAAGAEAGTAGVADASAGALEATAAPGSQAATLTAQNTAMGLTPAEQAAQAIGATQTGAGSQAAMLAEQNTAMGLTPTESYANLMTSSGAPVSATGSAVATPVAGNVVPGAANPTGLGGTFTENAQNVYKGLPQIGKVVMANPMSTVGAAAAPLLMNAPSSEGTSQGPISATGSNPMGLMSLSPNFQRSTPTDPRPYYEAQYEDYRKKKPTGGMTGYTGYAGGGVVALAGGGMDPMNPMQNAIYPQSQQEHTNFATSSQYPNSMKSAMGADYDTRTNPMTGQELPMGMASGGIAGYASGHLASSASMPTGGVYRDTDPNTASLGAYEAALYRLKKGNKLAGVKTIMPNAAMTKLGNIDADVEDKADGGMVGGLPTGMALERFADGGSSGSAAADSGSSSSGSSSGASGVSIPAGFGGDLAAALLSGSGLGLPDMSMLSGLGALRGPVASGATTGTRIAYSNPYSDTPVYVPPPKPKPVVATVENPNAALQAQVNTLQKQIQDLNYKSDPLNYSLSFGPGEMPLEWGTMTQAQQNAYRMQHGTYRDPNQWLGFSNYASGGQVPGYNLGGYSDGGRMLKGPGDGMSDSIPASIGTKQPARLADGEFVVPADVVSHLGNGSTDAGAKKLYGMMDKVRQARTGNKKQGKQIKADKYLPK